MSGVSRSSAWTSSRDPAEFLHRAESAQRYSYGGTLSRRRLAHGAGPRDSPANVRCSGLAAPQHRYSSGDRFVPAVIFSWSVLGDRAKANQTLQELDEIGKERYVSPANRAAV